MNAKFTQILSLLVGLMVLSASALYAQPANNECSGAIDISALFDGNTNTSTLFDNTDATSEASDPAITNGAGCFAEGGVFNGGSIDNSVWFSFPGDGNTYQISTTQCTATNYITDGDTQIAVYGGDCGNLVATPNGCNEDGPGAVVGNYFAQVTIETVVGTTYYMLIDGYLAVSGEFCIEVTPSSIVTLCDAGSMTTIGAVQVQGQEETFVVGAENFSIPTTGQHWWLFLPTADAGGGQFDGGAFGRPTATAQDTFNAALNTTNPPLTGTWEVYSYVTDPAGINNECDRSDNFLTVLFDATPIVEGCFAGNLTTNGTVMVDEMNPTFTITSTDRIIPFDGTIGGAYTWFFYPGPDGTGSGAFSFGLIGNESSTYTADLNGVLGNDLGGTWYVKGQTSTDGTDINTAAGSVCDITVDSLTIIFPEVDPGPCDAGSFVSQETQLVCPGSQVGVALVANSDSIPAGGSLGWLFDNTNTGGTGGAAGGTILTNASTPAAYDNDLNGILSDNNLAPLEGAFVLRSVMLDAAGLICSQSTDSILVLFGDVVDLEIVEDGNDLTAFVGVNFMDYTYAWSTMETGLTITPTASGDYSVTATDGLGCETVATIEGFVIVSTNEAEIVNNLSVAPNPTSGLINVALDLPASKEVQLSVIDITGKEVMNLAPVTFTSRNFEVNLQDQADGLYLLRFRIGDDVVTRRVVKN